MKLLRDPLFHFLIAGGLLFAGYEMINRGEPEPESEPVRIGEGEIRWLSETFTSQWQRTPTEDELRGLVASLLEEELLAREAQELGLAEDDTVVRRRLAQKLAFLVEDTTRIAEPKEADLRQFYSINIERFRPARRVSFTHIFFNAQKRRNAEMDAKTVLSSLGDDSESEAMPLAGDPLLLEPAFDDLDAGAMSNMFGSDFAEKVLALKPGRWSGPIKSGYGLHLVRLGKITTAEIPPFDKVRHEVLAEWRRQRQSETKAAYLAKLREKYGVVLDDSVKAMIEPGSGAGVPP